MTDLNMTVDFTTVKVENTFLFQIQEYADIIDSVFRDELLDAEPGIYSKTKISPLMTKSEVYRTKNNKVVTIDQALSCVDDIYNPSGKIVVSARLLKSKQLSTTPFYSYRGTMVAIALIQNTFDQMTRFIKRPRSLESLLSPHFKPSVEIDSDMIDQLKSICDDLLRNMIGLTRGKEWCPFFVKVHDRKIIIEQCEDFRIHQWREEHGHEYP